MDKESIQLAAKKLAIKMVYLSGSEIKLHNDFDPLVPGQELVGQFRIGTEAVDEKEMEGEMHQRFIRFHVSAGMRYLKGPLPPDFSELDEEKKSELTAMEVNALFVAEYAIVDGEEIPEEAVKEFGRVNAPFNVWPYWREYCQSTCSRMALPVTVIPMLMIE